jgi:L-lactate dehydrogenase complex protein LldF
MNGKMGELKSKFLSDSNRMGFDKTHRAILKYNIGKYQEAVVAGLKQFSKPELAKKRAAHLKYKTINELEKYLIEFESNFIQRGGKVIWAQDATHAVREILQIAERNNIKSVVKSKSMTTEEIGINDVLEGAGIQVTETDLGEYVAQLSGEKPYHIVTPIMQKSKENVAELFCNLFDLDKNSSPEIITDFVRKQLRERFTGAGIGISGANFLIADTGSVALTENEGNGMMSFSFPQTHIVIAGIEKLIPSLTDLSLFWPMLASYGTGQNMTVYNSILSGPKRNNETDGPREMYVVLLNNRRTEILKNERQRVALSCIRCGACLNICPVYRTIGGHAYQTVYSGPIGSVISPHLKGMAEYGHLSFASTLCGACTEACPVLIPLHMLLLLNRNEMVSSGFVQKNEKRMMKVMKWALLKRKRMNMGNYRLRNYALNRMAGNNWKKRRDLPRPAIQSFNLLWKENHS